MSALGILAGIFAISFGVGFSGAVPPGPMFAATVMHAREHGWLAGVFVSIGHGLLEIVTLCAIVFGAGGFLAHPLVLRTVAIGGGAFLVAMGLLVVLRPPAPNAPGGASDPAARRPSAAAQAGGALTVVLAGVWTSISQPYFLIWWAAVGSAMAVAAMEKVGYWGVATFYVGHVLADATWFIFVAATVGAGRRALSETGLRRLHALCGVLLAAFGLAFVAGGVFVLR